VCKRGHAIKSLKLLSLKFKAWFQSTLSFQL
jgi:hypothetical protein